MNANEGVFGNINKYINSAIPYDTQKKWAKLVDFYLQIQ